MGKRLLIGALWWLAATTVLQFVALVYGFPADLAPFGALLVALAVVAAVPTGRPRPADRRRIFRPRGSNLPRPESATEPDPVA